MWHNSKKLVVFPSSVPSHTLILKGLALTITMSVYHSLKTWSLIFNKILSFLLKLSLQNNYFSIWIADINKNRVSVKKKNTIIKILKNLKGILEKSLKKLNFGDISMKLEKSFWRKLRLLWELQRRV